MSLVLGVIPARYASTRFPGKPLAPLGGGTMIEQVWRSAAAATRIDRLVIATDDQRIFDAATRFGAEVCMTGSDHVSGSDRVAEVSRMLGASYEIVINIQGDEALLTSSSIDRLIGCFDGQPRPQMATLSEPIESVEELFDPNVVKLVADDRGRALYFSRSPIPYHRGKPPLEADFRAALDARPDGLDGYRKHQGIYAYACETLQRLTGLAPTSLEGDEGLEQLRALQHGISIAVIESDFRSLGVDTPDDLERAARRLAEAT